VYEIVASRRTANRTKIPHTKFKGMEKQGNAMQITKQYRRFVEYQNWCLK
jgi:hypothetical protein